MFGAIGWNAITVAWGNALLHFLWQGLLLAAVLAALLVLMRHRSAAERYVVRCAALAAMALAPVVTFLRSAAEPLASTSSSTAAAPHVLADGLLAVPAMEAGATAWSAVLVSAWAIGAAVLTLRIAFAYARIRRWRSGCHSLDLAWQQRFDRLAASLGVRAVARVVEEGAALAPAVVGIVRPVVLLPARLLSGLSEREVESVLLHELAHLRRRDPLVNFVQTIVETGLFFHPAVWWVSRGIRREREFCCDDIVVRHTGGPMTYARALTSLEEWRTRELTLQLSSKGGSLMSRIQRIIGPPAAPAVSGRARVVATSMVALALLTWTGSALAVRSSDDERVQVHIRVLRTKDGSTEVLSENWIDLGGAPATRSAPAAQSDPRYRFHYRLPPPAAAPPPQARVRVQNAPQPARVRLAPVPARVRVATPDVGLVPASPSAPRAMPSAELPEPPAPSAPRAAPTCPQPVRTGVRMLPPAMPTGDVTRYEALEVPFELDVSVDEYEFEVTPRLRWLEPSQPPELEWLSPDADGVLPPAPRVEWSTPVPAKAPRCRPISSSSGPSRRRCQNSNQTWFGSTRFRRKHSNRASPRLPSVLRRLQPAQGAARLTRSTSRSRQRSTRSSKSKR